TLVAWQDDRPGATGIYGARVTPSGTVLDPSGLPLWPRARHYGRAPALASDGTQWMMVVTDDRTLWAVRIASDGTVLDPDGIPIATGSFIDDQSVAFDGSNFLVAWQDGALKTARLSSTGTLLDPTPHTITTTAYAGFVPPPVAFDGKHYWLA